VVELVLSQIFSYFVKNVTEANQTVAFVKYTTGKLALIVVMERQPKKSLRLLQHNVQEQQRKEQDAEIGQPIQMGDVIYTNNKPI
jgi:hypothetical protein